MMVVVTLEPARWRGSDGPLRPQPASTTGAAASPASSRRRLIAGIRPPVCCSAMRKPRPVRRNDCPVRGAAYYLFLKVPLKRFPSAVRRRPPSRTGGHRLGGGWPTPSTTAPAWACPWSGNSPTPAAARSPCAPRPGPASTPSSASGSPPMWPSAGCPRPSSEIQCEHESGTRGSRKTGGAGRVTCNPSCGSPPPSPAG